MSVTSEQNLTHLLIILVLLWTFFGLKKKKILSVGGKTICQAGKDCN